jgi:hypothetical protein
MPQRGATNPENRARLTLNFIFVLKAFNISFRNFRRQPHNLNAVGYVFGHQGAGADNNLTADGDVVQNDRSYSKISSFPNDD